MKKRFLIITVAQTIIIVFLVLFVFVQKTEADRQRTIAEDNAKVAREQTIIAEHNAQVAQEQRAIADHLRTQLDLQVKGQ